MSEIHVENGCQHGYTANMEGIPGRQSEEGQKPERLDRSVIRVFVEKYIKAMLAKYESDALGNVAQFVLCAYCGIQQQKIPYHDTGIIDEHPEGLEIEDISYLEGRSICDITIIIKEALKSIAAPPQLSATKNMSFEEKRKWQAKKEAVAPFLAALEEQE